MSLMYDVDRAHVHERQQRLLKEAAMRHGFASETRRLPQLRKRLGGLLVNLGTRLQADHPPAPQTEADTAASVGALLPAVVPEDEPTAPPRPASLPAAAPSAADVRTEVLQALRQLPKAQQQVLILYLQTGCTLEEIARILRAPRDVVKLHLYQGCRSLRQRLGDQTLTWLDGSAA